MADERKSKGKGLLILLGIAVAATVGYFVLKKTTPAIPPAPVLGCTDKTALNYDPLATQDDGSCKYYKYVQVLNICKEADNSLTRHFAYDATLGKLNFSAKIWDTGVILTNEDLSGKLGKETAQGVEKMFLPNQKIILTITEDGKVTAFDVLTNDLFALAPNVCYKII